MREGPAPPCLGAASGQVGQGRWGHSSGRGSQTPTGRQGQGDENGPGVWGKNGLSLKPATLRFSEDLLEVSFFTERQNMVIL